MSPRSTRGAQDGESRAQSILRVLRLSRLLELARTGYSIEELADRFRVTTRTVRRDLRTLQRCGADITRRVASPESKKVYLGPLRWTDPDFEDVR